MKTSSMMRALAVACILSLPAMAFTLPAMAEQSQQVAQDTSGKTVHHHHHHHRHHHGMMNHQGPFETMDLNHDGFLSKDEAMKHFTSLDTNHDGKVSKEEWMHGMMSMHGPMDKHGMKNCHDGKDAAADHGSDFSRLNK